MRTGAVCPTDVVGGSPLLSAVGSSGTSHARGEVCQEQRGPGYQAQSSKNDRTNVVSVCGARASLLLAHAALRVVLLAASAVVERLQPASEEVENKNERGLESSLILCENAPRCWYFCCCASLCCLSPRRSTLPRHCCVCFGCASSRWRCSACQ